MGSSRPEALPLVGESPPKAAVGGRRERSSEVNRRFSQGPEALPTCGGVAAKGGGGGSARAADSPRSAALSETAVRPICPRLFER